MNYPVNVEDHRFSDVQSRLEKMRDRAFEFAQTRSSFQIEKFIGMDEYSPVSKFRHLSHNSYVTMGVVKENIIQRELILRQIKRIKKKMFPTTMIGKIKKWWNGNDNDYDIELHRLEQSLTELEIKIKGGLAEVSIFEKLCDQLELENGGKFTYKQLEKEEPNYWKERLEAQIEGMRMSNKNGIDYGNFRSYIQAIKNPILPESKNQIKPNFQEFTPSEKLLKEELKLLS